MLRLFPLLLLFIISSSTAAQTSVDEDQLGAWYMYFFTAPLGSGPLGVQGDVQYRSWNAGGDLEQLLLRGGLTYRPQETQVLLTLGYANITSGTFGDSDATSGESRVYQEALLPQRISDRVRLTHRFRYEQRWVEGQDFRTRYRYNIFVNVLLNNTELERNTLYLALYNELFINGQTSIGNGRTVQFFDRNRSYAALGYGLRDNLRVQLGYMRQRIVAYAKPQVQLSLHHSW
ncbi:hypothetical protein LEM8419_03214 [Neolewinella maritima]|uniref:DUF2490 domain-containing protein n=1 Tax=Neolewinella maritima TaxID=1383882 RepID=A0ABN8FDC4_9BACT|nr:DUF2490 domain-containing protein [Neolewinella maritima]CAH1002294.1 hypothetical protein LEM8419_03214 [Neolewinella maritima]